MALKAPKGFIDESDSRVAQFGHPAPAWLFPYADLMTELVCFFVILYALSAALDKEMQKSQEEIEKKDIPGVETEMTEEGLKISLTEKEGPANFKSGFADLTGSMRENLAALAPDLVKLAGGGRQILVQGHTDDLPIHNEYFWSNWELSASRATTVVEYMINEHRLPAPCVAAMGFGEHQPLCREQTAPCRDRNRRVVFLVRNPALGKSDCGEAAKALSAPSAADAAQPAEAAPAPEEGE